MVVKKYNKINIPYKNKLEQIRRYLKLSENYFPYLACQLTSKFVKKTIELEEITGLYLPTSKIHYWNYNLKKELYIDLTMDQFSKKHDKIMILSKETTLLKKLKKGNNIEKILKIKNC